MSRAATRTGGREATKGIVPGRMALSVGRPPLPEPEGFDWTLLTDVARLESGHTPSRSVSHYWNGDIPWIGIRDATSNHGRVILDTADHITAAGVEDSSARVLPEGTVCLSRTASVGYVVQMGRPMATSQDFVNWACGPRLNSHYLRYLLQLEQDSVRRFAHGTTHQTMYYPEAKALHALIPGRRYQDAVVEVLGALDNKIAANDRLLRLLDELNAARVAELVNLSSCSMQLRDVLVLHYGKALPASRRVAGSVAVYGSGGQIGTHHEALVPSPGVVIGRKGTVGAVYWAGGPHYPIDTTYFVEPTGRMPVELLYFMLRRLPLGELNSDSAVPGLNREEAYTQWIAMPTSEKCRLLAIELRGRLLLASAVQEESDQLAATRDELLPLLMSGKVRVRDAEGVVSDVI